MSPKSHGKHVRKVCACGWRVWPKCEHPWYFTYKLKHGVRYRFSLDAEFDDHIASKIDAETRAAAIRTQIDAGTFERRADRLARERRERDERPAGPPDSTRPLTIAMLGETYFENSRNRRTGELLSKNERLRWDLAMRTGIVRADGSAIAFGDLPIDRVDPLDVEALKTALLGSRIETITNRKGHTYQARRGGTAAVRGTLGRVRAFFRWAIRKTRHVQQNPFRVHGEPIADLFAVEPPRDRRLRPGEEERLLKAANPHLKALIVAALETGCRIGELLGMQWQQVRFDLNEIHLAAKDTKARRARHLPMSQRLRSFLEMRRIDSKGEDWPLTAFVFGDGETGERVKSVKIAWENCRLKAHGYVVKREANGRLTAECRQQLGSIGLRFHDLRREAGSRFLELGMAPHYVQAFLDHAKLSTTSRYLTIDSRGMHAAMETAEKARRRMAREGTRGKPVAKRADSGEHPKTRQGTKSVQ